jgi:hypothetical protein
MHLSWKMQDIHSDWLKRYVFSRSVVRISAGTPSNQTFFALFLSPFKKQRSTMPQISPQLSPNMTYCICIPYTVSFYWLVFTCGCNFLLPVIYILVQSFCVQLRYGINIVKCQICGYGTSCYLKYLGYERQIQNIWMACFSCPVLVQIAIAIYRCGNLISVLSEAP